MRILVSNDDGIYSPGIAALAEVASEFGSVCVVAPDVERSAMGHAITASRPRSYRPTNIKGLTAYRVNGTPADCVALGAYQWDRVDLVLSGLNIGLNLGNSIWHSGTLAAAKQAALLGIRGVASAHRQAPNRIRRLQPMDLKGARHAPRRRDAAAREREPSASAARAGVDAHVGAALRRPDCSHEGPAGS